VRRTLLPLRRSHAIAVVALTVGLAGGVVVGPMLTADASVTPIRTGQYCTPRGGVYRTTTLTLLCAQAISSTRREDPAWRWRNITPPACPVGYARRVLRVQAVPRGATTVRWVQVVECVLTATATPAATVSARPSPSATPVASGTTSPSPAGLSPSPSPPG
jgi:hypothetical protein